jgi:hypothetical protein
MKGVWFMPPSDAAKRLQAEIEQLLRARGVEDAEVRIKVNAKGQRVIGVILPEWFDEKKG